MVEHFLLCYYVVLVEHLDIRLAVFLNLFELIIRSGLGSFSFCIVPTAGAVVQWWDAGQTPQREWGRRDLTKNLGGISKFPYLKQT